MDNNDAVVVRDHPAVWDGEAPVVPSRPLTALDYWRVVRTKKSVVFGLAFVLGIGAFFISARQPSQYRAVATLEIEQFNEDFLEIKGVSPTSSATLAETFIRTQTEILRSRALGARVVDRLGLADHPRFHSQPGILTSSLVAVGLREKPLSTPEQAARAWLSEHLTVRHSLETNIVELMFEAQDPALASDVVNTLSEEFIQQNLEVRWQATQHTSDWLMGHLDELRTNLKGSEEELVEYARQEGLLYTEEESSVAEEKLRHLQQQHTEAQRERIEKQSQYERSKASPADALPAVLEDETLQRHVANLVDLRRQLAELRASFKGTYYKVRRAEAETAELEAALETEKQNILLRIRNEYDAARRREALLAVSYQSQARVVAEEAAKGVHYDILRRGVETTRTLYEAMLQKMKEASIASALRASNVRVVDPAEPPRRPFKPMPLFNATLGLLCGVFLGAGFIVAREVTDRTLRLPGDVVHHLNLRALGEIPSRHLDPAQPKPQGGQLIRLLEALGVQARVVQTGPPDGYSASPAGRDRDDTAAVFLAAWWQRHRDKRVGLAELWDLATGEAAGVIDLGRAPAWKRKARLGRWVNRLRNCRHPVDEGFTVRVKSSLGSENARQWRLSRSLDNPRNVGRYRRRNPDYAASDRHGRSSDLRSKRIVVRYSYRPRRSQTSYGPTRTDAPGVDRLELTTWHQRSTLLAEAFQNTATSIQHCGDVSRQPRVIALTSPNPMEGKTTVSCNLAIALADRGARVLLVDADLRQPRLHEVFDVPNRTGLCTLLGSRKPVSEGSIRHLAQKTEIPSLHLLTSGACEMSIPHLLSSDRLSEVFRVAREEFDMVLVDTPPMLHLTDARILAKVTDGVVMVFRARRTNTEHAMRAIRSFHQDGTRVLGAILNDFDVREVGDWYLYQTYYDHATKDGSAAAA